MTEYTRRHILTGAAVAALTPCAAAPAHAVAPLVGKQAPSFYRARLGDFEITVVSDGARAIPLPATFVRNVSNAEVLAAAEAAYMPKGSIVAPFNPMVVNTGAKLVLIDTGYGPGIGPTVGLLPATLAAAGIDPKAIDIVLISHMHGDHILGLKTPDGASAQGRNSNNVLRPIFKPCAFCARRGTVPQSRSLKRWILPVAVRGRSCRMSIQRGYFHGPARSFTCVRSVSSRPSSAA
jgi:Metallo-beta-lactamase superfamily